MSYFFMGPSFTGFWMLPTDEVYGTWPSSGELDIIESRGTHFLFLTKLDFQC